MKVTYKGSDAQSFSFIKRQQVATINLKESKKEIGSQIQVLNFGYVGEEIDLFKLANIYVDNELIPLFTSFKSKKSKDYANLERIDEIEQLLAKLRLEFLRCSQDQISYDAKLNVDQIILQRKEVLNEEANSKEEYEKVF